jgi:hypothetical protein
MPNQPRREQITVISRNIDHSEECPRSKPLCVKWLFLGAWNGPVMPAGV